MSKQNFKTKLKNQAMFNFFKKLFSGSSTINLKEIITNGAFLVDVRSQGEYLAGHVKGSTNIPLDQIKNKIEKFKVKKNIVVFCQSGMRSSQAKGILEKNGFTNVINGKTWKNIDNLLNS
ncbi:rhodanese-like domain-containing protein [Flavobacterium psychrophilum]|uniref:Rhodanese-like domain protein n=2 Tax=Flavobacterium psychrophilum TaxID=96345 RepID=A6H0K7_FLAPJ|nr:rhodanese-like domain-containing protein [Flavobacterium psychrophilum]CAL43880.1 Rhodanese-like domain protein [Flavobacterium psychrophilum JIP02/86]AIJ37482.1 Rhodanese-related sulfurtransferase [Flavobacterium psychrophilum]MBM4676267.1 rhodanese-like domain-containing protein [Flavobacterium psychrophilum]MCB5970693.1 rhodanese-like domain-containing protein [Flavobacterium psychrophilum]MCB5978339.1 rhodanese-like domain-containing protein [Flavobacterium psychrophilum]